MIHTLSNKTSGIIKMQKFTLHTHNNELNFDGLVSAENMIIEADEVFNKEPVLIDVPSGIHIVGDTHGNIGKGLIL